ncbi:hypothetical protein M1506_00260 [Patescibacteria group bacterium]|nr:hypothetical protein [Patescibacteria group bacterium]
MNTKTIFIGAIVVLACLAIGYSVGLSHNSASFGTSGVTNFTQVDAKSGFLVNGTSVINSSAQFVAGVSTTQAVNVSGTTTLSGISKVVQTTSSTLVIGSAAATNNSGCLELGDSSATGTIVYITASGATVTATTTKPASCR